MATTTGDELVHWITSEQLPRDVILQHLNYIDALQLASTCTQLWSVVGRLVMLARANKKLALGKTTPDWLRIPLLTGLTKVNARANDNDALTWACLHGHLVMAHWLTKRFGLTADDARAYNNGALRWASENGHLAVAQWLTERFKLTADDARADNNYVLKQACRNSHSAVVSWLEERFGITRAELGD